MEIEEKMDKNIDLLRLISAMIFMAVLCILSPVAYAEGNTQKQLAEVRISAIPFSGVDFEYYKEVYFYDSTGRLIKKTERYGFSDEASLDDNNEPDPEQDNAYMTVYDYYDNGALRMSTRSRSSEMHYDRYGIQMDSPKPAVPHSVCVVWFGHPETVEHIFDEKGNLICLKADDTIYEYSYNSLGHVLTVESSDPYDYNLSFTYLKNGGYILTGEAESYDNGRLQYQEEYDYDGRILRENRNYIEDNCSRETIHEYSSDGSKETIREYKRDGDKINMIDSYEIRKTFNENGQVLTEEKWRTWDKEAELQEKTQYEYDGEGYLTHLQFFHSYSEGILKLHRDERFYYQAMS